MAAMTEGWKPATCSVVYRALQQFFDWLIREGEIDRFPMEHRRPPAVPEQPVAVSTDDQLHTLLAPCDAPDFVGRRDATAAAFPTAHRVYAINPSHQPGCDRQPPLLPGVDQLRAAI